MSGMTTATRSVAPMISLRGADSIGFRTASRKGRRLVGQAALVLWGEDGYVGGGDLHFEVAFTVL